MRGIRERKLEKQEADESPRQVEKHAVEPRRQQQSDRKECWSNSRRFKLNKINEFVKTGNSS